MLGQGSSCTVRKIRTHAVKRFDSVHGCAALTEIAVLSSTHHPAIVQMYSWSIRNCVVKIHTEYLPFRIDNTDLKKHMFQILSACAYLHSRGIAHGDIKPSNIRVDANGNAKLIDFGNARFLRWSTCCTWIPTTIDVRAPELFRGEVFGKASDVWSLGMTWMYLLNASNMFKGDTFSKLWEWKNIGSPVPLPIIGRMLEWDPRKRATFAELLQDPYFAEVPPIPFDPEPVPAVPTPIPCETIKKMVKEEPVAKLAQGIADIHPHYAACVVVAEVVMSNLIEHDWQWFRANGGKFKDFEDLFAHGDVFPTFH